MAEPTLLPDSERPVINVPRRGVTVPSPKFSEGKSTNFLDEFMTLVQPQSTAGQDSRFPEAPITPQSLPGAQKLGSAVIQGVAKGTGAQEVLAARGGGPKLISAAAPLFDQFMKLVQSSGEAVSSDNVMEKSGEIGGQTLMGGLTVAGAREAAGAGKGEIGTFGGKGARAADLTKMQRAEQMEAAGATPEQIRNETWWFRDVDKQMKFEIPDKGSKFNKPQAVMPGQTGVLGELYNHPRLYNQYPELKGVKVFWDQPAGEATYTHSNKSIHLDPLADEATLRKHVAHEIQHWIQYKEDFALGGNYQALLGAAREIAKIKGIQNPKPAQLDDIAFTIYKRLAGEVESRNVEARLDMSPQELLAKSPQSTAEFRPEQQVIRKQGMEKAVVPEDLLKSQREISLGEDEGLAKSAPKGLRWLENIVSPSTRSATAEDAAGAIRAATGQAARDQAITMDRLEPFHRMVNAMPDAERLALLDYIEGRSKGVKIPDPSLQGVANVLRDAVIRRQAKLSAMPSTMMMQFIDDYFPHFWANPAQARNVGHQMVGRMGSSASLQKRAVPTIADGIAMGLKPLTTNPLEATARYITSMDNFIARTEVVEAAKNNGTITFPKRQQVGASGHPGSGQLPRSDLVPVEGVFKDGVQGVAPEDWARVWNNYVRAPWSADFRNFANAVQKASNNITTMELGLSGFHVFTMANEAFIGELARGIANIAGGEVTRGLGAIGKAVAAPVRLARLGSKAADVYLDRSPGSQNTRKLVDLITRAGGRMVGKEHAADYEYSAMGNFWTAWKRGALKQQLREAGSRIKANPLVAPSEFGSVLGKAMETVAYPLFVKYIPNLKNGAMMELLGDWLHANPTATYEQQLAMARKLWNSIDNRFGEMVQDNLFWNRALKQSMQTAMRSYSWNLGTIREIGGGMVDAVRGLPGGGKPTIGSQLSINSPDFNPKLSYVLALPIGTAIMGAVYQFLKTGELPPDPEAAQHPMTGGQVPGFGGRGDVPERVALPGYMKDVYGWWHDPVQEAKNKIATGPMMAARTAANEDYQGHMIRNPNDPAVQQIKDYFNWVIDSMGGPISLRTLFKGEKEGSNISVPEAMLGIRPAPSYVQDPEGYEKGMSNIYRSRHQREQRSKERQKRSYGGPQE